MSRNSSGLHSWLNEGALSWITFERTAVKACLQQLKDHGYFVPDFSYFLIKASNVTRTTERLCQLNQHDKVCNTNLIILLSLIMLHLLNFITLFSSFRMSLVKPWQQWAFMRFWLESWMCWIILTPMETQYALEISSSRLISLSTGYFSWRRLHCSRFMVVHVTVLVKR